MSLFAVRPMRGRTWCDIPHYECTPDGGGGPAGGENRIERGVTGRGRAVRAMCRDWVELRRGNGQGVSPMSMMAQDWMGSKPRELALAMS